MFVYEQIPQTEHGKNREKRVKCLKVISPSATEDSSCDEGDQEWHQQQKTKNKRESKQTMERTQKETFKVF